jgi:hypothetical protein
MPPSSVCAIALAAQLMTATPQNVQVIPVNNETDPVQLGRTQYDASDPAAPVVILTIVNRTQTVLSTGEIWIVFERFFTRQEMRQNGDGIAWSCGSHSNAAVRNRSQDIQPGTEASVVLPIPQPCRLDHAHEHFFVYVERITTGGRFDHVIWKRELGDALRVLLAKPHR